LARFVGNAIGRTLAETVERASGYLSDKDMPKANVITRGRRFSPRPAPKTASETEALKAEPEAHDAGE
jgi:hypothetical protein